MNDERFCVRWSIENLRVSTLIQNQEKTKNSKVDKNLKLKQAPHHHPKKNHLLIDLTLPTYEEPPSYEEAVEIVGRNIDAKR